MAPIDDAIRLATRQYGAIQIRQARALGVSGSVIDRMSRQGHWQLVHPGVHLVGCCLPPPDTQPDDGPPPLLLTRFSAALLAAGPHALVAAESAAHLWGLQGLPRWRWEDHVHVIVPPEKASRTIPQVAQHAWRVKPGEAAIRHGLPVTCPGRTLRDTVLHVDRACGVSLIDSALHQGLVDVGELEELEAANLNRRGSLRTRRWWGEADARAESTFETRVRLICTDGGLPPDELQHCFFTPGGVFVARVDLYWKERRLAIECDGRQPHGKPEVLANDRRRQNALAMLRPRIHLVRLTWEDLRRPDYILDCIRRIPFPPLPR
ncbi:hypothetical protein [Nocardiopsis rhodophaea]|uniref:hypothetical protein n=1 Tax=Nocardiopsis rhodophaea TaxID=280238 RepID=UPI0031D6CBE7